ncbi:hypothetical protein EVS84_07705 [Pseudomonas koreensis]|uniref:Uncharacterized protein n=2 Tax=Pseudomonas TaxID=286 RepID=A0AAQ2DBC6_9PSED|nr:hypothetical protein EGJ53_08460 [Pseudomonas fluorescens]RYM43773.1 hypothetical protein EVS84_07705 [Pseudomonas koreensis]TDK56438.1 hypothetical protein E1508_04080 [Pseudomonas moraviensis]THF30950.1 hypothetical protein E5170_17315 [Pseudomonas atacamensis]TKJ72979.1 hypothetical protein PspCFBP13508_11755 [Pseudomonas sp. CFBP13508]
MHQSLWERACSRRGRHIQHLCRLIHRLREQARSHRVLHQFLEISPAGSFSLLRQCGREFQ